MNTVLKNTLLVGSGLIVGGAVGFIVGQRLAYKSAARQVDELMEEMTKEIDKTMAEIKRGLPIAFDESYFEEDIVLDEDEALLVIPEGEQEGLVIEPDADSQIDVKALIEKMQSQKVDDFQKVTYPGQDDEPDDDSDAVTDDEYDNTPTPTVPEFVSVRDPNGPYLISIDEFMQEAADDSSPFSAVEMVYYDGDDVLIDSKRTQVPDINATIGRKNLNKFGKGTTDPSQMYIKNERLELVIEVTKDDDTYTHAILGHIPFDDADLAPKVLRMRPGDGE